MSLLAISNRCLTKVATALIPSAEVPSGQPPAQTEWRPAFLQAGFKPAESGSICETAPPATKLKSVGQKLKEMEMEREELRTRN